MGVMTIFVTTNHAGNLYCKFDFIHTEQHAKVNHKLFRVQVTLIIVDYQLVLVPLSVIMVNFQTRSTTKLAKLTLTHL